MKKIGWIFLFLAVLFAGDRLLGWYLERQVTISQFRYSQLYNGAAAADFMIIGNSKGLNIYIPSIEELTSKKAFSLCYNGMPGDLATVLTKDYIDRYPKVKTILLELCIVEMGDEQLIPGFASYMHFSPRIDSLIKVKSEKTWYTSKISHIYKFNNEVFQRAFFYKNRSDNDWTSERIISEKLVSELVHYDMQFHADDGQLEYIKLITDYCHARNIDVKLIIAPFFPGYLIKNLDLLKYKTEKLTGCKVYDYSTTIQRTTSFSDYLHMNVNGCKEFTRILKNDGLLTQTPNSFHSTKF